jgi:hypothetical protein
MAAAKASKSADAAVGYRVLVGINYPEGKRAEIGDVVTDLPAYAIKGLLAQGVIEESK